MTSRADGGKVEVRRCPDVSVAVDDSWSAHGALASVLTGERVLEADWRCGSYRLVFAKMGAQVGLETVCV